MSERSLVKDWSSLGMLAGKSQSESEGTTTRLVGHVSVAEIGLVLSTQVSSL